MGAKKPALSAKDLSLADSAGLGFSHLFFQPSEINMRLAFDSIGDMA